jgi:hypothetical protein
MNRILTLALVVGCSHEEAWSELRSEAGRFRVEMPGTPVVGTHQTMTLPSPTESRTFLVERGPRGSFQVSYYDLTMQLPADSMLDAAKIDCMSPLGGKWTLSAEHPQQLGAVPGDMVTATAPTSASLPDGGYEQAQCFVAGQRMYHLIAVGPNTADEHQDAARFLGSFRLL